MPAGSGLGGDHDDVAVTCTAFVAAVAAPAPATDVAATIAATTAIAVPRCLPPSLLTGTTLPVTRRNQPLHEPVNARPTAEAASRSSRRRAASARRRARSRRARCSA